MLLLVMPAPADDQPSEGPRASYADASHSTVLLQVNGKQYLVDVAAQSIRESGSSTSAQGPTSAAADLFRVNCAKCHGPDGRGIQAKGSPDFTSRSVQAGFSDQQILDTIRNGKAGRMPAWSGKLSDAQITELASYIRTFASGTGSSSSAHPEVAHSGVYKPGDDLLVNLPTGRALDRHSLIVNFTHRFAYDPAFTGPGRGAELLGLDGVSVSSFGFRYGVTDNLSVDVWRSPSFIGRPIQIMAAYNLLDENREAPLNLAVRASIEGQNNFQKNFTENIETIFSRSIQGRAQFYVIPTMSFNARRLVTSGLRSDEIPAFPGVNTLSIGFGLAVDIRPTVALVAEIIPTLLHADDLGIHRPVYSFGIQKKIWRHAFTLALTNGPGTTVSQRAGTRATFAQGPDTPSGLFLGFDITRQIH